MEKVIDILITVVAVFIVTIAIIMSCNKKASVKKETIKKREIPNVKRSKS